MVPLIRSPTLPTKHTDTETSVILLDSSSFQTDQTRLFEWVGPALLNFGLTDKISIMKTSKFKILSFLYHLHKVANEMEWRDGC